MLDQCGQLLHAAVGFAAGSLRFVGRGDGFCASDRAHHSCIDVNGITAACNVRGNRRWVFGSMHLMFSLVDSLT
jgi:hypothetical protein